MSILLITWLVVIANSHELPSSKGVIMETSWYGPGFHGRKMANGERFDSNKMVVAHKRLPLETTLLIINPINSKRVIAKVKDRGPYVAGRDLDVSEGVKKKLGLIMGKRGTAPVEVHILE